MQDALLDVCRVQLETEQSVIACVVRHGLVGSCLGGLVRNRAVWRHDAGPSPTTWLEGPGSAGLDSTTDRARVWAEQAFRTLAGTLGRNEGS